MSEDGNGMAFVMYYRLTFQLFWCQVAIAALLQWTALHGVLHPEEEL